MPPIRHKRKQDSLSSGSSSSTIKPIASRKKRARPLLEQPFVSGGKYRRVKKRSKLTGLATPFFVRPRTPLAQSSSTPLDHASTYADLGHTPSAIAPMSDSEVCQAVPRCSCSSLRMGSFAAQDDANFVNQLLQQDRNHEESPSTRLGFDTSSPPVGVVQSDDQVCTTIIELLHLISTH
jgi:hypothetical protein